MRLLRTFYDLDSIVYSKIWDEGYHMVYPSKEIHFDDWWHGADGVEPLFDFKNIILNVSRRMVWADETGFQIGADED